MSKSLPVLHLCQRMLKTATCAAGPGSILRSRTARPGWSKGRDERPFPEGHEAFSATS